MLKGYCLSENGLKDAALREGEAAPNGLVWVDLLEPTAAEDELVERVLGVSVPSREEMQEIEPSSRLYRLGNDLFMTASVLTKSETEQPETTDITFILAGERLITVRYADPRPFAMFAARAKQAGASYRGGDMVLVGLLDGIVDRTADLLERTGVQVDAVSRAVFEQTTPGKDKSRDFHDVIRRIGRTGDLATKARESLASIDRLATFLSQGREESRLPKDVMARLKLVERDVHSLTDHASFLNHKINFLLDATLGMINIEQNSIIKIFSVAAVVFLPPTLIASIFGMNFKVMPELDLPLGYPLSLLLMVVSAVLPYLYFKRRGWL